MARRPSAGAFRPQRLRLYAGPRHRRTARRGEIRSSGELGDQGRHGQVEQGLWPSAGRSEVFDRARRRGRQSHRASARRRSAPRMSSRRPTPLTPACSTCRPTMSAWTTSRSACPTRPASPMSARRCRCIRLRADQHGQLHRLGREGRQDRLVGPGAVLGLVGCAVHGGRRGVLRHAGRLSEGGRCQDRQGAVKFKTPSGIIGNVMTYEHGGKQYVAVLSGVGGWAGIGLAAGLTDPHAGLGAVGGYAALSNYTALGGQLTASPSTELTVIGGDAEAGARRTAGRRPLILAQKE